RVNNPCADLDEVIYADLLNEGRVLIGPALAKCILENLNYSRQRRLYPPDVALYAEYMGRGKWTPGSQIAFVRLSGRLYLINGQHRLHAVIAYGGEVQFQVLILDAASQAELASLYYRFDVNQRGRSAADVLASADIQALKGISKTLRKSVYGAVALLANGMARPNYSHDPVMRVVDNRLELAEAWAPEAVRYEAAIKGALRETKSKLRAQGVVAVGLITLRYQPEIASEFWQGVALQDGLSRDDPRSALERDMRSRTWNQGAYMQPSIAAAQAWSAYFSGKRLTRIHVHANARVRIAGTPFEGSTR
ncbi:MAG TPA: hypothetical protein VFL97_10780, partial [Nitrococcus sp.]|nr:hypothetical protein [Nitrococcus sp.]